MAAKNTPLGGISADAAQTENDILATLSEETILAGHIAKASLLECSPQTSLQEAARRMDERKVSSILITDNNAIVGIWTERDALKLDLSRPELLLQPISNMMSTPVKTVPASLNLKELAVRFKEERIRHYIVVDEANNPCGVVSQSDVVIHQGIEHYLRLRSIDSIVHRGLQSLPENATPAEVTNLMREACVDAIAIRYDNDVWGIITERDLIRHIANEQPGQRAGDIASHPVLTVGEQSSLYLVRNMLIRKGYRHIGVTDSQGGLVGLVSFRDILGSMELTYVQELQQALRERDEALNVSRHNLRLAEQVIESSLEGIMITDLESRIISVNPSFTRLTGYSSEEVIGKTPALLSSGHHDKDFYLRMWQEINTTGSWQGEVWNKRKNGQIYPELLTITTLADPDGEPTHYAALFNDISMQKEHEERIRQLAYYDALTGLPNRRLFVDRMEVAIAHAQRTQQQLAVLFVDLDHFKRINDSLGHAAGDQFLRAVAARLQTAIRTQDTIARMGGDEFIALLSDIQSPGQAIQIARRMLETLQSPVRYLEHELLVTCTIGVSIYPDDGMTAASLLSRADTAMYRAKSDGRNAIQLYTESMNAQSLQQLSLENALHQAIDNDQFELYFQPIVDTITGKIFSAEALLRWRHPELGIVPPNDFLPLAEELGLMVRLSDWVLESACRQLAYWNRNGYPELRISINMSDKHFYKANFLQQLQDSIQTSGCNPSRVTLELTERMLMDNHERTLDRLTSVRNMGLSLALDDFGTGWSSLSHLRNYPLNELKIDRDFVGNVQDRSSRDASIIASIIELSHKLHLRVVAEGIENKEQLHHLRQMGCDLLQGYYFSPPVPAADFTELLARDTHSS